jgi:magnesium-transporting ATPase (P-type)
MVGDGTNDIDAIMSSNVGIFLGEKKNLNTLLSHYIINENNLIDIITIIKNGRGYYENDNLLLPVNAVFSSIWISLIIYSYYYNSEIGNLKLSLLTLSVFILGLIGFTIKPDYNISFNYLASNEKLLKIFNFLQFFGIYIIKTLWQVVGIMFFHKNENISKDMRFKTLMSYMFILIWSQTLSTCLAFNINIFYRKPILSNLLFMLFYALIFGYIIYLLTLNDIGLGNSINSSYLYFELDKENIDYLDDTHKMIFLYIIIGDFVSSYGYIKILKIIFDKKANKIHQYKINNINRK